MGRKGFAVGRKLYHADAVQIAVGIGNIREHLAGADRLDMLRTFLSRGHGVFYYRAGTVFRRLNMRV